MAKRYKEKEKKNSIFKIKNILLFIAIVAIIILAIRQNWFYFIEQAIRNMKKETISSQETQEVTINIEKNKKLNSNLLKPSELNNEIDGIIKEGIENVNDNYIIKIHYKLEELNKGTIDIYYKAGENELIKMSINITNKEIENVEKYEDEELLKKDKIVENLEENIEEDFNKRKKEIISEKRIVNIIITNTEVVINTEVI